MNEYDFIISTNYIDTFMNTFQFWQSHYLLSLLVDGVERKYFTFISTWQKENVFTMT